MQEPANTYMKKIHFDIQSENISECKNNWTGLKPSFVLASQL